MLRKIGKAFAISLSLGCAAALGDPTAALKVDTESFVAGRPFNAVLLVKGGECSKPEWSGSGFRIVAQDSQVTGSETNQTYSFSYRLVPLHAGTLALPSFWVTCAGEELETGVQVISVQKPRQSPDLTVQATISEQEVFVGQPVRYAVEWRTTFDPGELRGVSISHPLQYSSSIRVLDVKLDAEKEVGLPVGNRRIIAAVLTEEQADRVVTIYRFEQIVIPQEAGELVLRPLSLLCSRVTGGSAGSYQNVPSYFDNNFFEQVDTRSDFIEYFAETRPLVLQVKPLPVNESGTRFSGIVGACELQTEIAATEVKVGDPLLLTVRLKTPFAQGASLPDLRSFSGLSRRFWVPETQSEGRVEAGVRVYEQLVRPLHTGVQMVPPLDLLIFNPETEMYEMVSSDAIGLRVVPNEGLTRFTPPADGAADAGRELNGSGVWFNRTLSASLLDRVAAWSERRWPIWLFGPILIGLVLEPLARRRRLVLTDPKRARALKAHLGFRRGLAKGVALELLLQEYLAARFDLRCGTVTSGDVSALLARHHVSQSLTTELKELMTRLDQQHFSSRTAPQGDRKLAADMIRKLEGELS